MAKTYYTLVTRDDDKSPWAIHFGDYDRATVADEADDLYDEGLGVRRKNLKIVKSGDRQADIDAVVRRLNEEESAR